MAWTTLKSDDFEGYAIPVKYGTGKLYGAGWLYGGALIEDWLDIVYNALLPVEIEEDFESAGWFPPVWSEEAASIAENMENALWLRPTWIQSAASITENFEGSWV